jgi:hypothetical protein
MKIGGGMVRRIGSFFRISTTSGLLIFAFLACGQGTAEAHHTADHSVVLHVNNTWPQCAIVFDPSLTQSEFHDFIQEVAPMLYFRPMAGAKPLGKFKFDIGLETWKTSPIQDWTGKWNNTFSHPNAQHWLTGDDHTLNFPVSNVRMGMTDKVDVEAYYSSSAANYTFWGLAMKFPIVEGGDSGWDFAVRPGYSGLLGVADMTYQSLAFDALASKDFGLFRPYLGATFLYGMAAETTTKVSLNNETATAFQWIIGAQLNWHYLSTALEADFGVVNMYSLKFGVSF